MQLQKTHKFWNEHQQNRGVQYELLAMNSILIMDINSYKV